MKPVNLLPSDSPVVAANAGKPNFAAIGGAAFGFIAIVGVAGYFAMARVDSVKSETLSIQARATEATTETGAVNSQVASLGQPVVDSDKELARGQEAVLVSAYAERHDFPELAAELQGIMEGTGGWYEKIEASSAGGDQGVESRAVTITGVMPTQQLTAGFEERASATRTLANAEITKLESTTLTDLGTKRNAVYWRFTIEADLMDTVAPSAGGATGGGGDATGTAVGNAGGTGELTLSLESKPKPKVSATNPAGAPAKPKNPFDVAAAAAVRGGGA